MFIFSLFLCSLSCHTQNLMDKVKDMTVMWDDQSATPYAFTNSGSVGLVSYDDERSICLKTEYALTENLQGFVSSCRCADSVVFSHVSFRCIAHDIS